MAGTILPSVPLQTTRLLGRVSQPHMKTVNLLLRSYAERRTFALRCKRELIDLELWGLLVLGLLLFLHP